MLENTTKEFELNPEIPVTASTPPTFLLQNEDDNVNGVKQSLVYYIALKNAGVPVGCATPLARGAVSDSIRMGRYGINTLLR
jgi:hypothetical protein